MRRRILITLSFVLPGTVVTAVRAQSSGSAAAYVALNLTPPGALPPVPLAPNSIAGHTAFSMRYGYFGEYAHQPLHHLAAGLQTAAGSAQLGFLVGTTVCDGCRGRIMAGVDWLVPITAHDVLVGIHPAVGFGRASGTGAATLLSAALTLPVSYPIGAPAGPTFVPFFDPGIGLGHVSVDGGSETGLRPMLGGGLMIAGRGGAALHVAFQKVFVERGDVLLGVGITIAQRR